jgi:hypothetical protein
MSGSEISLKRIVVSGANSGRMEILEMPRTTDRTNKSNGSGATRARPKSKGRQGIGEEIANGLEELADALERGANIAAQFNCRH